MFVTFTKLNPKAPPLCEWGWHNTIWWFVCSEFTCFHPSPMRKCCEENPRVVILDFVLKDVGKLIQVNFIHFGCFATNSPINPHKNYSIAQMTCEFSKSSQDMFWYQMIFKHVSLWKSFTKHRRTQVAVALKTQPKKSITCWELLLIKKTHNHLDTALSHHYS